MNGTGIDQFVTDFVNNGWPVFIEFWVVIVAMAIIPFIMLINNSLKKPKLIFQPTTTQKQIKRDNGNVYYTQVDFWVNVANIGKKEAKDCHVFLKLMDEDFNENLLMKSSSPQYSVDDPFPTRWYFLETQMDSVNIPVSNRSGYSIKIPFHIELIQTTNEEWPFGDAWKWENPIQELYDTPVEAPKQREIFSEVFGVIIQVTYGNNKTKETKFLIKIPHNKKTEFLENDPNTIQFFEIKSD